MLADLPSPDHLFRYFVTRESTCCSNHAIGNSWMSSHIYVDTLHLCTSSPSASLRVECHPAAPCRSGRLWDFHSEETHSICGERDGHPIQLERWVYQLPSGALQINALALWQPFQTTEASLRSLIGDADRRPESWQLSMCRQHTAEW